MSFRKQTIKDYDVQGKTVLLRADYNVPLDESGAITDDFRIKQSLPTIQYLLEQNCRIVICSHLGRPKDAHDTSCSLQPVAEKLQALLEQEVRFVPDCVGKAALEATQSLEAGCIALLENLRFHNEEEANDSNFAAELAQHAEVFVQDGFGVVHRAHASTDAITKQLPSVSGLLLEQEVRAITDAIEQPQRPLLAIVGGAKVHDKLKVLKRFVELADVLVIGGAMANTFLQAKGISIGNSLAEPDDAPLAEEILQLAQERSKNSDFLLYLPQDAVVTKALTPQAPTRIVDWGSHVFADIEAYPKRPAGEMTELAEDDMIADIGPYSGAFIAGLIQLCKTVIWNGAMGVTEIKGLQGPIGPYSHGTHTIVEACGGVFGNKPMSITGGGDTVGYLESISAIENFDHVSTGGGASLDLLAGTPLPGVEALLDNESSTG